MTSTSPTPVSASSAATPVAGCTPTSAFGWAGSRARARTIPPTTTAVAPTGSTSWPHPPVAGASGGWAPDKPAELPAADPARTLTIVLTYDDSDGQPGWFVRVVEKPGCMSEGDTIDEALAMIADAIHAWDEAGDDGMHADPCDNDCRPLPRTRHQHQACDGHRVAGALKGLSGVRIVMARDKSIHSLYMPVSVARSSENTATWA